jgi:DEAD/DEAH box helicase domain-containing protein
MIPSVLAHHVEQGIKDFLRTTFPITTPFFANILETLINEPGQIFKGPYLDIQLPFQEGHGGPDYFPNLPMPFQPHLHQEKAFDRLAGPNPKSTIVATGTGSGKTECFLYPILDYCYQHRGEPGIKAILIYPMNALATDQAARLARLIHNSKLNGHITAGIYVGQKEKTPSKLMTMERLISNKDTLRLSPPDILLTNYKMLDYLLIRPEDRPLWIQNTSDSLRFLVVDELHTFDGAQGADLSCLIRRLKARLAIESAYLCCVGTSATLGAKAEQDDLLAYATSVFGETFSSDAIITESRIGAGEFLEQSFISYVDIVPPENATMLDPANHNNYQEYIKAQHQLWFEDEIFENIDDNTWRIALGNKIKAHLFFQNLLKTLNGKIRSFDDIFSQLEKITRGLKNEQNDNHCEYKIHLINSLIALISEARVRAISKAPDGSEKISIRPFLNIRIQLWMRELRRMVAEVSSQPRLRFSDDLNEAQQKRHLPLVYCRECGSTGWSGLKRKTDSSIKGDLQDFYHAFFSNDPKVVYLFPEEESFDSKVPEGKNRERLKELKIGMVYLCSQCLNISTQANLACCPTCDHETLLPVYMPDVRIKRGNQNKSKNECPYCNTQNSLNLLGSRAASLSSVMIVQLYSSTFNDDKKLLTFSDNVQDAAHRAGFFNSRTYRFNFRIALQKVVLAIANGCTLAELPEKFIAYWTQKIDPKRYISTFLAPDMEWLGDVDFFKNHNDLPDDSVLIDQVNHRIGWEIFSEYGFRARIGRTLEKTSSSVIYLDQTVLNQAVDAILEQIQNEIGYLRALERAHLMRFLSGVIVHLKNLGGIYIPSLDTFIENYGNPYVINRTIWMPNFGRVSRTPAFLTTKTGTRFDQLLGKTSGRITWYQKWVDKCFFDHFPNIQTAAEVSKDLYALVLKALVSQGIMAQKVFRGDTTWGIRPEVLRVSSKVTQFWCTRCGHHISVANEERNAFQEAPCQRIHCYGTYQPYDIGVDYYGKLYATGDVERIFARDHTGLLKRDEREQLEMEFKLDNEMRKPWFPNLLSCTPTLEMGIDIGDLSSLILCSVPPAQTNYIQRIGRAGRRDGNALNLTVANARPHDLFFFAAPEEMLSGHVDSPGIFLDASAVLERQFTAFCFDKWIATETVASIPRRLGSVLNHLEPVNINNFPHSFIYFIETNQSDLLDQFILLFKNNDIGLTLESESQLKVFVEGDRDWQGSLHYKIMNGLHHRKQERDSLRKKVQILNGKIKKKKNSPRDKNFDEEIRELHIEKSALQALVKSINDRDTFNFFTDEGLLPNYAFPEAGVMLNSLIHRKKQKVQDKESAYETWHYEYERPAASAIQELAPANTFYAEGRKVKIDQVDMTVSEIETWRFCNHCSHKELIGRGEENVVCMKCGSPMWADIGQKRLMLKMRQVFASASDRESRISDDSDDREPVFYIKQMLVEFDEKHIVDAYKVDADFPFGFEFLSKVDFCEINFGEKTEIGEKIAIAGVEMPRQGFSVCRVCGKVQHNNQEPSHAFICTAKNQTRDRHLIDCLYLYRQFTSEAIRILLPVSIISESNQKLHSFIAAIQLGLKKKFKGKIDHLQTTVHEEPVPDSTYKRKYLVLYDTVPGGTGYLKQLMRSENQLMDVLEMALTVLKSCICNQDADKDGCYQCLFAYRNSYSMSETSRNTAIEMLAEIVSYRDRIRKTDNISHIPLNTLIDSELEARFVGALKRYRSKALLLNIKNNLVNGKPGYFLKIGDRSYDIEPQVELGKMNDVSIQSRADFLIRPARLSDAVKPIAVFLDGYIYHQNRIGLDMAQRMAIVQSGNFYIWSLTWHDVEHVFKPQGNYFADFIDPASLPSGGNFKAFLEGYGLGSFKKYIQCNSFELLIHFLENPDEQKWQGFMLIAAMMHINPKQCTDQIAAKAWIQNIETQFPDNLAEKIIDADCPGFTDTCLYANHLDVQEKNQYLKQHVLIEKKALKPPGNPLGVRMGCYLSDDKDVKAKAPFQSIWNGFLRLYNYYQFLPYSYFVTSEGNQSKAYDAIQVYEAPLDVDHFLEKALPEKNWKELKDLTDEDMHPLLDQLQANDWPAPEAGYELEGENGEIIACAELAWEGIKIAFLLDEEKEYQNIFINDGWKTFMISEILKNPDQYMKLN